MRARSAGLLLFLAASLWAWLWEFVRSLLYEQGSHMLIPVFEGISPDQLLHLGPPAIFAIIGGWLFWKTRPPIEPPKIIFDPANSLNRFWSLENSRDESGKPQGAFWQYPEIQISFEEREPYEVSEISAQGKVLSTIRIGLKAIRKPFVNCKIYIEKITPIPPLPGIGFPMLLQQSNFTLRPDEDEMLIDIASHWDHITKFRFNAPDGRWPELNYIDDKPSRIIEIKITATGFQKSMKFKLWTDDSKRMHMEHF
jgi:hypothetical protein